MQLLSLYSENESNHSMPRNTTFLCPACKRRHPARHKAVECCSQGDELTPAELEAIGQGRLFDEGGAASLLPESDATGQNRLF
jgi:hypothetical protein